MTNITILGAAGRMGKMLIQCAKNINDIKIVGTLESDINPLLGKDAGLAAGIDELGVKLTADFSAAACRAEVLLDFTTPSAAVAHASLAAEQKKAMVIGTTGMNKNELADIERSSKKIPIVLAPNMSPGINLLFSLVSQAARILADSNIEICEIHHKHKKDAPSGTALKLAEIAALARNWDLNSVITYGRNGKTGARPEKQIGVHAIRAGDIVGEHRVLLAGKAEYLELVHRASSRECFAFGALHAAKWVIGHNAGLYTMQDVLELS